MPRIPLMVAASIGALILSGFAFSADAAPRLTQAGAKSPAGVLILVEDEENAEVENLLEPEADEGTPMNDEGSEEKPADEHAGHETKPEDTGEEQEIQKEEDTGEEQEIQKEEGTDY